MKIVSGLLLMICLITGAGLLYLFFYGDGGADGLSLFFPLLILSVIFICSLIGFIISFLSKVVKPKYRLSVITIAAFTPLVALLIIGYTIFGFNQEYEESLQNILQREKSALKTNIFRSEKLGVEFKHVSGKLAGFYNNEPMVDTIVPIVKDSVLSFTKNGEKMELSDYLLFIKKPEDVSLRDFIELEMTTFFTENSCKPKEVSTKKYFKALTPSLEIFKLETSQRCNYEKVSAFLSRYIELDDPSFLQGYFIEVPERKDIFLMILQHNPHTSIAGEVERLALDQSPDVNKWFNTLKFVQE